MKTRNWGLGILAVGAALAVSAGTIAPHMDQVPGPSASSAPQEKVAPAATAKAGVVDEVLGLIQEPQAVFDARMQVSNDCMATAGFPKFAESGMGDVRSDMTETLHGFRNLTLDQARDSAYRHVINFETSFPVGDAQPRAMQMAYLGFDPQSSSATPDFSHGCRGAGLKAVYDATDADNRLGAAISVIGPAVHWAHQDPASASALQGWSSCMTDAGYPWMKTPGSGRGMTSPPPVDVTSAGPEARKLAVADVTCRDKTNLVQRLDDVLARYLTTAVEQHAAELAKVRSLREAASARAAAFSE